MGTPAQGNAVLLGFAPELKQGIRDDAAARSYLRPILPLTGEFAYASAAGGEVNQSGYVEQGVPGAVTGALDFGARLSVPVLFELVRTMLRDITKSTLESGVFQYVCLPDRDLPERELCGLFGFPPVDKFFASGVKVQQIAATIGNNTAIPLRVQGQAMHCSRLGAAVADGDNTGDWPFSPISYGPLATPGAGNLFLEVTALAPLRFKCKQAAGTTPPTMAGSTVITQLYDEDGDAILVAALSDTGGELGIWDENKDPLLICVPGTAADHADIDVGDIYYFPVDWDLPEATYLGGQRFTSAHQRNEYSIDGGSSWVNFNTLTSTLTLLTALTLDQGSGSRHANAIDRTGVLTPTLQFGNKWRSNALREIYERHRVLKLRSYFEGQLLAGGPNRESVKVDWARCQVNALAAPASNDGPIVETVTLGGITDDSGTPPIQMTFITDQDYDV